MRERKERLIVKAISLQRWTQWWFEKGCGELTCELLCQECKSLDEWFWFKESHMTVVKLIRGGFSHLWAQLELRNPLPSSLSSFCQALVPQWLLSQGRCFQLHSHTHTHSDQFPPQPRDLRQKRGGGQGLEWGKRQGEVRTVGGAHENFPRVGSEWKCLR